MTNSPIIFIHYGYSKYLSYVFECAKISNPDAEIILIGDDANKKVAQNQLEDFDFGEKLKLFDQVYKLIATPHFDVFKHGKDWNEFVFHKWFILEFSSQKAQPTNTSLLIRMKTALMLILRNSKKIYN